MQARYSPKTGHIVHSYARSEGVCGIIVCDQEYPSMVAHQLLSRILDDFLTKHPVSSFRTTTAPKSILFPELKDYITKYQNPENADSLMKIQKELDETKVVLHKTIEQMLDRGEKIEALADKSDRLVGNSSEMFKKAKAQNSCWYVSSLNMCVKCSLMVATAPLCRFVCIILYFFRLALEASCIWILIRLECSEAWRAVA